MSDLEILSETGTNAVLRLRRNALAAGEPFMINSKDLPAKQGYLEYPDSSISIVTIAPNQHSFITIRTLDEDEAQCIRIKFNLQ